MFDLTRKESSKTSSFTAETLRTLRLRRGFSLRFLCALGASAVKRLAVRLLSSSGSFIRWRLRNSSF